MPVPNAEETLEWPFVSRAAQRASGTLFYEHKGHQADEPPIPSPHRSHTLISLIIFWPHVRCSDLRETVGSFPASKNRNGLSSGLEFLLHSQ